MNTICDNCCAEVDMEAAISCVCGMTLCSDCASPSDHDCEEE